MKRSALFRILTLLVTLALLLPLGASARSRGGEPLISLDLDQAMAQGESFTQSAYYQARWLQVTASIPGTQSVTLRVYLQGDGASTKERVVYKRATRNVKDRYQSAEIFLNYQGGEIARYRVELTCGDGTVKSVSFYRLLLNLDNNTACLRGLRFRDVAPSLTDQWFTFRPIQLKNAADGTALDIIGSNMYLIGQLVIRRNEAGQILFEILDYDQLFPAQGGEAGQGAVPSPLPQDHDIVFSSVRLGVYHSLAEIEDVSHNSVSKDLKLGEWYDLSKKRMNLPVIVYLNARVSYNPNGLPRVNATQDQGPLLRLLDRFGD